MYIMDSKKRKSSIYTCGHKKTKCRQKSSLSFYCKRCENFYYCSEKHTIDDRIRHGIHDCKSYSILEERSDLKKPDLERYDQWLKHSVKNDYELIRNYTMVWPSMSVQWLPQTQIIQEGDRMRRSLILGTTQPPNKGNNHLILSELEFPINPRNEDKEEEANHKEKESFRIKKRINHKGEVQRARYMDQNSNIVATKSASPEVFVFSCSEFNEIPTDTDFHPTLILNGHSETGYGLSWNPNIEGHLLSASSDKTVCYWDVNTRDVNKGSIQPMIIFNDHEEAVWDIAWHRSFKNVFISVGGDKKMIIRDLLDEGKGLIASDAHQGDINSVSFSPFSDYLFATAGADKSVRVWDLRNVTRWVDILDTHKSEVLQVEWSYSSDGFIASSDKDNNVFVWNINGPNSHHKNPLKEDEKYERAPVFVHKGHVKNINDFSFCQDENMMIASVSSDNILQIWKIQETLLQNWNTDEDKYELGARVSDQYKVTINRKEKILIWGMNENSLEDNNETTVTSEELGEAEVHANEMETEYSTVSPTVNRSVQEVEDLQKLVKDYEEIIQTKTSKIEGLEARCEQLEREIREKDEHIEKLKNLEAQLIKVRDKRKRYLDGRAERSKQAKIALENARMND